MSNLVKPVIFEYGVGAGTTGTIEAFTANDLYMYTVDNRPLEKLAENDATLKDAIDLIVTEIDAAHEGQSWPEGGAHTYDTLDDRLDNMDEFLQQFAEIRNVQFSAFIQAANFLSERYTSGFMNGPFPDTFLRRTASTENNPALPSPFGAFYAPVETTKPYRVCMETRIEATPEGFLAENPTFVAKRKPIYVLVRGFTVPLYNSSGGANAFTSDGEGPVTINFTVSPDGTSGQEHRFDFSFLEVWLQRIERDEREGDEVGTHTFYPYGNRDWTGWVGKANDEENILDSDEISTDVEYTGYLNYRDIVRYEELNPTSNPPLLTDDQWEFKVIATIGGTDYVIASDVNSSGNLTATHSASTDVAATINYDTGLWGLTFIPGGAVPDASTFVRVTYRYRGVTDPEDTRLLGTLSFLGNGNYIQLQHRIRVMDDVDYATYPNWLDDIAIGAQGPNTIPYSGSSFPFMNGINEFNDGSLWYAKDTSEGYTSLHTFDGYVYALPLCAWSRLNSAAWDLTGNQNGGYNRSDWWEGLAHGYVHPDVFLDLRPVVFSERYDMRASLEHTLDRVLRGTHRSMFAPCMYDANDEGEETPGEHWGSMVREVWSIPEYSVGSLEDTYNYVRDIGLSTSAVPGTTGYTGPLAFHDGIRRVFSPQEEIQETPFYIEHVNASGTVSPIMEYDGGTFTITLTTDDPTLSGYPGAIINDSVPRLYWRGTRSPVQLSTFWTGLGTTTATAVIASKSNSNPHFVAGGAIDGYVDILYPECTGIGRPLDRVGWTRVGDVSVTRWAGNWDYAPATQAEAEDEALFNMPAGIAYYHDGLTGYVYVCDSANRRVVKLNAPTLAFVAQYPTGADYPFDPNETVFDPEKHLMYPVAVDIDTVNGHIYVADRDAHIVVQLDEDMAFVNYLGDPLTAGNDPEVYDTLHSPSGVAVSTIGGTSKVFIADTGLYRIIRVNTGLSPATAAHIGSGASSPGIDSFIQPVGLCAGSVGGVDLVYVADQTRIVVLDAINFNVLYVMGSPASGEMREWFRHIQPGVAAIGTTANEITSDADDNKFLCWNDRKIVYKFDRNWNVVATYGQDGVGGYTEGYLQDPTALVVLEDKGVVIVGDIGAMTLSTEADTTGRLVLLNADDLSYIGTQLLTDGPATSLALDQGFLLVGGGHRVRYYDLSALTYETMPSWPGAEWSITAVDGDDLLLVNSVALDVDNEFAYIGDVTRSKVYQVDVADGSSVATWDNSATNWPADIAEQLGCPLGMTPVPGSMLYVANGVDNKIVVLDGSTEGGPDFTTPLGELTDNLHWRGSYITGVYYAGETSGTHYVYVLLETSLLLYAFETTLPDDGEIGDAFQYEITQVPFDIALDLPIEFENVRGVAAGPGYVFVADTQANTITLIDDKKYTTIGQVGGPTSTGRGTASFSGPSGITYKTGVLWFTDLYNNRVMRTHFSCPHVEPGTGRITFLSPPNNLTNTYFEVCYTPYQGQWRALNESVLYGRHYVTDNRLVYITTLGRGTLTSLHIDGGLGVYANMIARLPTPTDVPAKAPRVRYEYIFAPEPLPITSENGGTPFLQMQVINRYPAASQEYHPLYGGGSLYDYTRVFLVQGPGPGWSDSASNPPYTWIARGYEATGTFPGGDVLETFPLKTISIPRLLFTPAVVEINGVGYMSIMCAFKAHAENKINDGPIVADLFRLYGNPGIKTRY